MARSGHGIGRGTQRASAGASLSRFVFLSLSLFLPFLFLGAAGCAGGGTSGTGVFSVTRMTGTAYSSTGEPLGGMEIVIRTPSEERQVETAADGSYDTFVEYEAGSEIVFSFSSEEEGISSRWTFGEVPEGTAEIVNRWDENDGAMRPTTTDFLDQDGDPAGSDDES